MVENIRDETVKDPEKTSTRKMPSPYRNGETRREVPGACKPVFESHNRGGHFFRLYGGLQTHYVSVYGVSRMPGKRDL
jgi:hypothetical protein